MARNICDAIALSGTSLRRYADRVGITPAQLSNYARGKVVPSAATYLRITGT